MYAPQLINPASERFGRAQAQTLPPPVGGWNDRDALDLMEPQDAVKLKNWFPRTHDVVTRKGYTEYSDTGEAGEIVRSLIEHQDSSTRVLLAGVNNKLFDVSTDPSTPVDKASAITITSDDWRSTEFNGYTKLVNGSDGLFTFDGTTLTDRTSGWTLSGAPAGVTKAGLRDVMTFKSRLYFMATNAAGFFYGGVGEVTGGTATYFDLSQIGQQGGYLAAFSFITQDGGDGVDDLAVFIMSSGDVMIYSGSNPGDATDWALLGVFQIGAPIDRMIQKIGSDVVVITQDGFLPLTKVLAFGRTKEQGLGLSDKIIGAASNAVRQYGGNVYWAIQPYFKGDMLIINVPISGTTIEQYVMNFDTQAWCSFDYPAYSWGTLNDDIYFGGSDGKIYQADSGNTDNGAAITVDGQQAWTYLGSRERLKLFVNVRPILSSATVPIVDLGLGVDFGPARISAAAAISSTTTGGLWGDKETAVGGKWGDKETAVGAKWSGGENTYAEWQSVNGMGYAGSLRVRASLTSDPIQWRSSVYVSIPGGLL